jgi:hypothetical protein
MVGEGSRVGWGVGEAVGAEKITSSGKVLWGGLKSTIVGGAASGKDRAFATATVTTNLANFPPTVSSFLFIKL